MRRGHGAIAVLEEAKNLMKKWMAWSATIVFAVGGTAFAQTPEDLKQELDALKAKVSHLESEKAAADNAQDEAVLESQINALTERNVLSTTVKSAANPVSLTGEFRFRNSWSLGDNIPGTTPPGPFAFDTPSEEHDGSWNDALIRLGFQYDFSRDVTAFAELQSHWAFGDGVSTNSGLLQGGYIADGGFGFFRESVDNGVSTTIRMHQAWLEVRNIFNRPELSSRTGRQEIALGNQFHFGNADWYNGYAFDGTRWDWDSDSFSLTALVLRLATQDGDPNQNPSFRNSHDDDELYSLYFTLKTIKNHQLDIYWIYINGHGGAFDNGSGVSTGSLGNFIGDPAFIGTAYWHTVGARIGGLLDVAAGLDWNLEFAYQFGDNLGPGFDLDIDAFALEAEVGLTFSKSNMFRLYVRFLWASGPEDDELGYIPLYPNRHSNGGFRARYGIFDLIPMTNVVTPQLGLHFDPSAAWTIGATVLYATTDEDLGLADDDYGWEIDVWVEYRYSENLIFNVGAAFVFADDALSAIWLIDDDMQFYGYIQARLLF
jgi:hypothetical protein